MTFPFPTSSSKGVSGNGVAYFWLKSSQGRLVQHDSAKLESMWMSQPFWTWCYIIEKCQPINKKNENFKCSFKSSSFHKPSPSQHIPHWRPPTIGWWLIKSDALSLQVMHSTCGNWKSGRIGGFYHGVMFQPIRLCILFFSSSFQWWNPGTGNPTNQKRLLPAINRMKPSLKKTTNHKLACDLRENLDGGPKDISTDSSMCSRLLLHSCGWWTLAIVIIPSSTPRTLLWTNSAINFSKGVVTCAVAAGHQKYILLKCPMQGNAYWVYWG